MDEKGFIDTQFSPAMLNIYIE